MTVFVGIDVSDRRGCAVAAIDDNERTLGVRWTDSVPEAVVTAVRNLAGGQPIIAGIDSPRMPLATARRQYWHGGRLNWRQSRPTERGHGRHCEVVIKSLGLANPQWTPLSAVAPTWMQRGFKLFAALEPIGTVYEVFPTASYKQLAAVDDLRLNLSFSGFAPGPKDALDAYIAAVTVREYHAGRGAAVGGGDGLGTIVLPRPVNGHRELLDWVLS